MLTTPGARIPAAWLRAALLAGILGLAGCVKLEEDLTIRADGSGTLDLNFSVSEDTIGQIEAMRRLARDLESASSQAPPPTATYDFSRLLLNPVLGEIEGKLAEYTAHGVAVEKLELKSREAGREARIRVRFKSLAEAARTDFFRQYGFSLSRQKDGSYRIHRGPHLKEPVATGEDPDADRTLTPLMAGFRVSLTVHTPSAVRSASTPNRSLYAATWSYEFDKNPNALSALQAQDFDLIFEGEDVKLPDIQWALEAPPRSSAATNAPADRPAPAAASTH